MSTSTSTGMTGTDFARSIQEKFSGVVTTVTEFRGETTITVPLASVYAVLKFARDELACDYLVDASSVDNMGQEPRFEMVYELYSYTTKVHLRVKSPVGEDEEVPTATSLWLTADWHEREVYDMMGLKFTGHPDLRRILMWEGYPHFPLRKEFPLGGIPTDVPDVAFTGVAPLAGGPFVTAPGAEGKVDAEPRGKGES